MAGPDDQARPISNRRKSPQQRKTLDYKKQRHLAPTENNDKSVRKWLPAAKARNRRAQRHASEAVISSALKLSEDDAESAATNAAVARPIITTKVRVSKEPLATRINRQAARRTAQGIAHPVVSVTRGWMERDFAKAYDHDRDYHAFAAFMRLLVKESKRPSPSTREYAAMVRQCMDEKWPFFQGLFADEPSWEARLIRWTDRMLQTKER